MFKRLIINCLIPVSLLMTSFATQSSGSESDTGLQERTRQHGNRNASETMTEANKAIDQLYHGHAIGTKATIPERIDAISAQFLGKPYLLGALGEGTHGYYDDDPLYRTDTFDCETYVDTVLALALAPNLATFKKYINQIRYNDGHISFIHRNHFTDLDWNTNNQKQGFIKDITTDFHDKYGRPIAKTARALIDKPNWYQHFSVNIIQVEHISPTEQTERLALLKQKGRQLSRTLVTISYIPLTALFNQAGLANQYVFNQIPNGAIIEIIRPNWDLTQQIGTHLNVSHLGFAIWKNGVLMFRIASSTHHRLLDCSMIDYLRDAQTSPTIKGINIQRVL